MERRNFLALLASAPIAALAPWGKMLEQTVYFPPYCGNRIGIRYVKEWDIAPSRYAIWNPDFAVRVSSESYESQPSTDAERLALQMVTEARARFHAAP